MRPLFTTYLLFILYVAIIVASTTDEDLLKGTTVKLPLLDANISIVGFYVTAPVFILVLHVWMLLHFSLICENLHSLMRATEHLSEARYSMLRQRLDNFTLLHAITHEERGAFRTLLTLINALILGGIPLVSLLMVQARFIAYHDAPISWWHRLLVLADIAIISYFWPIIVHGVEHGFKRWAGRICYSFLFGWNLALLLALYRKAKDMLQPRVFFWSVPALVAYRKTNDQAQQRRDSYGQSERTTRFAEATSRLEGGTAFFRLLGIGVPTIVSLFLLCFPHEGIDLVAYGIPRPNEQTELYLPGLIASTWLVERMAPSVYPAIYAQQREVRFLPFVRRNLEAPNAVLVKGGIDSALRERLRQSDPQAIALIEPLDLAGRNLSYADLGGAVLPRVILSGATLIGAHFGMAHLEGANLRSADLTWATFDRARMLGTDLSSTTLAGATFYNTDLRLASFEFARAPFSFWRSVNASGGNFKGAVLEAAILRDVDFRGASIQGMQLSAARLDEVTFPWVEEKVSDSVLVGYAVIESSEIGSLRQASLEGHLRIEFGEKGVISRTPTGRSVLDYKGVLASVTDSLPELLKVMQSDTRGTRKISPDFFCPRRVDKACIRDIRWTNADRIEQLAKHACDANIATGWRRFFVEADAAWRRGRLGAGIQQENKRSLGSDVTPVDELRHRLGKVLKRCLPAAVAVEIAQLIAEVPPDTKDEVLLNNRFRKLDAERAFYYRTLYPFGMQND